MRLPTRAAFRASIRSLATLIAAVGVATCADAPSTAAKPALGGRGAARVGFVPVFSTAARAVAAQLADFGITFDHVRVVIVRPVADTVKDTTIAFAPGQADVTLDLTVDVNAVGESFDAGIDYTNPSGVVFHGQGTVQSHAPDQPAPPQQIVVNYAGPGATVTHIVVSPKTSSVVAPATVVFSAAAFDANNSPVPGTPINWATNDPTIATISNSGTLTTTGKGGTVTVTATTLTGASDNGSVTVSLPVSGISLVSGGGQTGKAGSTLAQPGVVRVTATDGSGVGGVSVNFAAPAGGKVGATTVTTDANGNASTSLTLGGALGPQSFAAVALGFSVAIPETATVGDPDTVVVVSGGGQTDTVKRALKLPLVVKVADHFGNALNNVTVNWQRISGSGTLAGATSTTGIDGLATIAYTLGTAAGVDSIAASVAGVRSPATFVETAIAAGASTVAIVSGNGQTARISQVLAPFVIKVTDDGGNPVKNATVAWSATNGTLSATTTTDATGQSSNTMTLGTVAGGATATATVLGKAAVFTATVQTGIVSRILFQPGPPAAAAAGTAITPAIQVSLQDAGGNQTASTNSVTIALGANPVGGTLTGTLTRSAVGGIATFDDLKLDRAGAGYTLVASSTGATSITSAAFTIGAGVPGTLIIVAGDAQTGTVNTPATAIPSVKLVDLNGNVIAGAPVTFTPAPGSGTAVPSSAVSTDANGIATLTSWTFGVVSGAQSLFVASPGVPSVTIHASVLPGAPAHYVVTATPTTQIAGGTSSVTAQLIDAFNNVVPASGHTVNWTSTGGGSFATPSNATGSNGATPAMAFTTSTASGVTHTVTATDAAAPAITGSATVTTISGAAARLAILTQPSSAAQSGVTFASQPVLQLQDANGNAVAQSGVSITAAIATGGGTLGGTVSAVTDGSGRAAFGNLKINGTAGSRTLAFTSTGLTAAASTPIVVTAGGAAQLAFVVNPSNGTSESAIAPPVQVALEDADGNLTSATGAVTITLGTNPVGGTLSGTLTRNAVAGIATFNDLEIDRAGAGYSLAASSVGVTGATSTAFNITAGAPASILILAGGGQTGTVSTAAAVVPSVKLVDASGNAIAGAPVTFTPTSGSGTVSPATAITTNASGVATLTSWTFGPTAGPQSLSVSSPGVPNITINATAVAGAAARLAIVTQPSSAAQSGVAFASQPVLQLQDASGNVVAQSGVSIAAAIATGGGTLGGTLAVVTNASGRAAFGNLKIDGTAGSRTLAFTSTGLTGATSTPIAVTAGTAAQLAFVVNPSNGTSESAITPPVQVALEDADGNLTSATGAVTITLSTNPVGGTLSGTLTRNAVGGIATFNDLELDRAGAGYSLAASSVGVAGATSTAFNITAGTPASILILAGGGQTGTVSTAAPVVPSVKLVDASGNAIAGAPVTFVPTSGSGTVSPATAITTNASGVATLTSWTFGPTAGPQSLSVSSPGVPNITINASAVAGAPARLVIVAEPSVTAQAGVAFAAQPVLQLQDANGNASPQSGVTVTAAIAGGGGTLGGTVSAVSDASGRATFLNLKIDGTPGSRTLSFTSVGVAGATSTAIAVSVGTAARLAFTVNPTNTPATSAISPPVQVTVRDVDGNTVTTATNAVAVSITSGTGSPGGVLAGTTPVAAVNGVATFSDLSINAQGTAYTLTATSGGLTTAVSTAFDITALPPSITAMDPTPLDAVFAQVEVTLTGARFVPDATSVAVAGGSVSVSNVTGQNSTTLGANFLLAGGAETTPENVTVTTSAGTSSPFAFTLYSVGMAPVQLGPSNGDSGGSPYSLDCPDGYIATALNVRGGSNVDQLQVVCQPVTGSGRSFGNATTTAAVGGEGGSPSTLACPANYVLIGLTGRIGNGGGGLNDQIAGVCAPVSGGGSTVTTASVGSDFEGSIAYTATCPSGLALSGIQGGAGDLLDRTQIKCR